MTSSTPPDTGGTSEVRVFAPGRVNLIGDHTDYTGGLAFPMAIQRGISVRGTPGGDRVVFASEGFSGVCDFRLPIESPASVDPPWARYVAGVAAVMNPTSGFTGSISSDLEVGGLSSSASLELAVALALGFDGRPLELAHLCQEAEHVASGVPCGIMDQLAIASARAGHAMLIDFETDSLTHVPVPETAEFLVLHSGEERELAGSAYAERRRECEFAIAEIGSLRSASPTDAEGIRSPVVAARARHVITENRRVAQFVSLLGSGDLRSAGSLMTESHRSLRDDYAVSTPRLDELVDRLNSLPGVCGARLTGAGFGGSVVALCEAGAFRPDHSSGGVISSTGRQLPRAFVAVPSGAAGRQL